MRFCAKISLAVAPVDSVEIELLSCAVVGEKKIFI
jgi:hypothetical protein